MLSVRSVVVAAESPESAPQMTCPPFESWRAFAPAQAPVARKRAEVEALCAKKFVVVALVEVELPRVTALSVDEPVTNNVPD